MAKQGDGGLELPDSAFAPPAAGSPPLELDPAWVAERAAKQAAARTPPRAPRKIAGVLVALALIAIVVCAITWIVLR